MNTKELFKTNNYNNTVQILQTAFYTQDQYIDAISYIQSKTYTSIPNAWGRRWRQNLANSIPFVLKLLRYGYNDFLVQRISSNNSKWIDYDENIALSLLKCNNLVSGIYYNDVSYPVYRIRNGRKEIKKWVNLPVFPNRATYIADSKALLRIIDNLIKIGAMAKVSDSFVNSSEKYSSSYIISKDRLKEVVELFINTFTLSINHTSLLYTYNTISNNTNIYTYSTYRDTKGGANNKVCHFDTVIEWNNNLLPEDEQISFTGRRAYANICSFFNEEKHLDNNGISTLPLGSMTIQKYCNKVFGENNWFEFDRRGSIYNLTRTLNGKGYLDNSIDIYELLNGKPFNSKEERKLFKLTQMMVYFSTRKRLRGLLNRVYNSIYLKKPCKSDNYELAEAFWKLLGCPDVSWEEFENLASEELGRRQKIMKKVIGNNSDYIDKFGKRTPENMKNPNHIFVHESKAYLLFVTKLREQNIRVVQVYDGFCLPKDCGKTEQELDKLLNESITEYMSNYLSE